MFHRSLFVLGSAIALAGCIGISHADEATKDIDGIWVVQSVLRDPPEDSEGEGKGLRIVVGSDQVAARMPGTDELLGTVGIRRYPKRDPKAIDFLMIGDSVTALGIYAVEDDTIRVCVSPPGEDRPTEFTTPPGSRQTLVELKRAKP